MTKRSFLLILLTCFFFNNIKADTRERAYQPGEKLKYVISYGLIRGGRASLTVKEDKIQGQEVYHLTLTGRTVGLAHSIYRVKDTYESYIDPISHLPIKAIRDIREGRYRKYNVVEFNQEEQTAHSLLTGTHKVPPNIQDILSAFYYARQNLFTPDIEPGEVLLIQTFFSDELFPLRIRFMGYETVRTRMGRIYCYKFVPVVQVGRVFKNEDDMTIWISADKNRLPIRIQFNLFLGSLNCDLDSYSGLAHEFMGNDNN